MRIGRLYDYFGGRADLAAGRVRFVGDAAARIAEDYLRILRFFRFFARYGRPPADAAAQAACAAAAPGLRRLSGERIQAEMTKLLAAKEPLPALRLMVETGVLGHVDPRSGRPRAPGPAARGGPRQRRHGPARRAAAPAARRSRRCRAGRRALASGKPRGGQAACHDPRASAGPSALRRPTRARDLHRLGAERYADLVRIAAAEADGDTGSGARPTPWPRPQSWEPRRLPVGGDDILALGVPAGPRVGAILAALEAWWVARDFAPDRAACLAEARRLLAKDDAGVPDA